MRNVNSESTKLWGVPGCTFGVSDGLYAFTKGCSRSPVFFWLLYPLQWRYPSVLDKWPSTAVLLSDDVELMQKSFTNWHSPRHAFGKANSGT